MDRSVGTKSGLVLSFTLQAHLHQGKRLRYTFIRILLLNRHTHSLKPIRLQFLFISRVQNTQIYWFTERETRIKVYENLAGLSSMFYRITYKGLIFTKSDARVRILSILLNFLQLNNVPILTFRVHRKTIKLFYERNYCSHLPQLASWDTYALKQYSTGNVNDMQTELKKEIDTERNE